ncbi:RcpC/CpaB family pilus assembly protein [Nonomuraea sp. NPDC002799]
MIKSWLSRYGRHRRLIAVALAAMAVLCSFLATRPAAPAATVLVAARDLSPGPIRPGDLHPAAFASPPAGAVRTTATGQVLAAPMRKGEPLTDVRLLRTYPLPPGLVATPVRIADPAAASLLSPGSTISVLATVSDTAFAARLIAENITVITTPAATAKAAASDHGALLVLATTPSQAAELAAAQTNGRLSITIKPN